MKTKITPRCALCSKRKPLKSSHIIPRFVYQIVRRNQPYSLEHEKVPVVVSNSSKTIQKDVRQYKRPLLCNDCEKLFSAKETAMASIIASIPEGVATKSLMAYGGADLFDARSPCMTCHFTPEKISAMKYFSLSCLFRQVVVEEKPINGVFFSRLKRYLLGCSDFGTKILFKVNIGETLPMATSVSLRSDGNYAHAEILVPDFLMHFIISEAEPVLDEDVILVIPEDFKKDIQINNLCRMQAGDYRISPSFQSYLDREK